MSITLKQKTASGFTWIVKQFKFTQIVKENKILYRASPVYLRLNTFCFNYLHVFELGNLQMFSKFLERFMKCKNWCARHQSGLNDAVLEVAENEDGWNIWQYEPSVQLRVSIDRTNHRSVLIKPFWLVSLNVFIKVSDCFISIMK